MNVTELMSKITVMLSGDRQTVVRAKFAELELVDGTKVMTEGELAVGAVLNVVAEDGSLSPAPMAMHEATDGTLVTVGENGIIEAIEEASVEAAPAVEVEVEMEDVAVNADVVPEAVPATEALLQGIADIIAPFTEEIANLQEQVTALSAKFSDFSDEPAAKPIKRTFAESGAAKEVVAMARMERLAQIRNTKK
jgi:uncharacterized coiled-coil protein SlyX